jgi:Tat protein secretion system quality control protein TatD with DNase activity
MAVGNVKKKDKKSNSGTVAFLPPRILLHNYLGPPELTRAFTQHLPSSVSTKVFFGVSLGSGPFSRQHKNLEKLFERIRNIPDDRLVLESGMHDGRDVDDAMEAAVYFVAQVKGWSAEKTAKITSENSRRLLFGR